MKDFARSFYKSKEWKALRDNIMKRDGWLCQDCLSKGKYTPAEEVHHITEITPDNINDPSITLNPDNLVSLCRECHRTRHGAHERRYKVDEFGRVITM
ncbi:MAG: HNH endonuclease [Prevotella sp.]|nr:HNH endonuclease [Prevotella sp.]